MRHFLSLFFLCLAMNSFAWEQIYNLGQAPGQAIQGLVGNTFPGLVAGNYTVKITAANAFPIYLVFDPYTGPIIEDMQVGITYNLTITPEDANKTLALATWWPSPSGATSFTLLVKSLPTTSPVWSANPIKFQYPAGGFTFDINLNNYCTDADSYSSSNLPTWLQLDSYSGRLWGNVPEGFATYNFNLTALNYRGGSPVAMEIKIISAAPVWNPSNNSFTYDTSGFGFFANLNELCTGATSYTIHNKPAFLTLTGSTLTGSTPTVGGVFNFTIDGVNDAGIAGSTWQITIQGGLPPTQSAPLTLEGYVGSTFMQSLNSLFSGATSYSLSNNKPPWLTQSGSTMSGVIPENETNQNFIFDITATNEYGSITKPCSITIRSVIMPDGLRFTSPSAVRSGHSFSYSPTVNKQGSTISCGNLPSGLSWNGTAIVGTIPEGIESFSFRLTATKIEYPNTSMTVYVKVDGTLDNNPNPPPPGTTNDNPNGVDHVIVDNYNDIKTDTSRIESGISQTNSTLSRIAANTDGIKGSVDGLTGAINDLKLVTNNNTTNNTLNEIKADMSGVIDKLNSIDEKLGSGLDADTDPNTGYTKTLHTVSGSDFSVLGVFDNLLSPKGKVPPPLVIPLSSLNNNLPSELGCNLQDVSFDFSVPPVSTVFALFRMAELLLMTILMFILIFKTIRTFEF